MISRQMHRNRLTVLVLVLVSTVVAAAAPLPSVTREQPFLVENQQAMKRMMAGMTIRPSGDVDRDFVAMMIPHHQGAIDMAIAELRYGHNAVLRRISQEIIVEQGQEITAMRLAVHQTLPASVPAPDQPQSSAREHRTDATAPGMAMH